ncbi:MAG: hypothetical protein A3G34_13290 [Candidatus Lindowbacteria bacterium RIFCSPLOWO2_12_FULL_62_27]|nr:MAG: hypothetical protein A3I06_04650 [Candidatus Lindowbacteria bacterium RIFCSPLOWO2_02_FULL_62_12]OGH62558.1 MAG: hypothetical protein A3G34_13290 [Candidatus Lindowbacteria bacterium RIFCSPLOWO2_12_FULL_62_27]
MFKVNIFSPQLGHLVHVEVAFPPGYRGLRGPFPALVLNDAQNQWTNRGAYGGWHTDSIAADLFRKGRIRPILLVGILSPPDRDHVFGPPPGGRADRYADFIAETLLATLRRNMPISRNPADVGILGASFGSNAALFAGLHRPDAIGLVAAMSGAPHFGKPLDAILAGYRQLPMRKLYIDCGTRWAYDQPRQDDSTAFNRALMSIARARMPRGRFLGIVARGHFHNEEFWRKRVGRVLRFLYG